jgi:hypothetical protein
MGDHGMIEQYGDLLVQRDDLLPGGSKSRFVPAMFDGCDELVYASPVQGGMQLALAYAAAQLGKRVTIVSARRRVRHERTIEAEQVGAEVIELAPGYLSQTQATARRLAEHRGARYVQFGGWTGVALTHLLEGASEARRELGEDPPQVWCAAGSGLLALALSLAFPRSETHAVAVGAEPDIDGRGIRLHRSALRFEQRAKAAPPFPSCPHYDAKAWAIAQAEAAPGSLFWNVLGPSPTPFAAVFSAREVTENA